MAITAINLEDEIRLTHPDDKVDPTIFIIGAVDSRVLGRLRDRSLVVGVNPDNPDADADVKMSQNELAFEVVQFGLKGLENFRNRAGDVAFATERKTVGSKSYEVASTNVLRQLPGPVLRWLSAKVLELNELGFSEGN